MDVGKNGQRTGEGPLYHLLITTTHTYTHLKNDVCTHTHTTAGHRSVLPESSLKTCSRGGQTKTYQVNRDNGHGVKKINHYSEQSEREREREMSVYLFMHYFC